MKIIALDGVDGSAKSTQSALLRDWLHMDMQRKVEHYQMPGATPLGQELRRVVKSKKFNTDKIAERLIFAADTAQFLAERVYAERERPDFMVMDRWSVICDLIYGSASGCDLDWLVNLQKAAAIVRQCDLLIVIACNYETIKERKELMAKSMPAENCRIEAKGEEFMRKVCGLYNSIDTYCSHMNYPVPLHERNLPTKDLLNHYVRERAKVIEVIVGDQTVEEVRDEIRIVVQATFPELKAKQ